MFIYIYVYIPYKATTVYQYLRLRHQWQQLQEVVNFELFRYQIRFFRDQMLEYQPQSSDERCWTHPHANREV